VRVKKLRTLEQEVGGKASKKNGQGKEAVLEDPLKTEHLVRLWKEKEEKLRKVTGTPNGRRAHRDKIFKKEKIKKKGTCGHVGRKHPSRRGGKK